MLYWDIAFSKGTRISGVFIQSIFPFEVGGPKDKQAYKANARASGHPSYLPKASFLGGKLTKRARTKG